MCISGTEECGARCPQENPRKLRKVEEESDRRKLPRHHGTWSQARSPSTSPTLPSDIMFFTALTGTVIHEFTCCCGWSRLFFFFDFPFPTRSQTPLRKRSDLTSWASFCSCPGLCLACIRCSLNVWRIIEGINLPVTHNNPFCCSLVHKYFLLFYTRVNRGSER